MSAATANATAPTRRDVLRLGAAAGTSLVLGFRLHGNAQAQPATAAAPFRPNAWLTINRDGAVQVSISKTEMGQGTATGIAMLVADELDADWARISVDTMRPDGQRFMITGGSYSISAAWQPARVAGAQARELLRSAGAQALGVAPADCRTEQHAVLHPASGRRIGYGELVARAAALPVPEKPALKDPREHRLIGRPLPAKNLDAIVRAQAVYGLDVRVPGMLFAVIERSPVINGRLARLDARAARAVPGVQQVIPLRGNTFPESELYIRDGAAVLASSTWAALQGRRQLKLQWNENSADRKPRGGRLASTTTLADDLQRALADGTPDAPREGLRPWVSGLRHGTPEGLAQAFATAHRTLELDYEVPLYPHAPMEPMNAVAHWTPERCEVWAPCHFQSYLHRLLRDLTGLSADRVVVHTPLLGGSFGRRLMPDYAIEAALLSREAERPVQVLWTREDDMQHGLFSPPSRHRARVALAADGRILALEHSVAALSVRQQSERESIAPSGLDRSVVIDAEKFPYGAEEMHVRHRLVEQTIRVLWWRRGYTANHTLVNETLLDECAHAMKEDPLAYRQRLLGAPRELRYENEGDTEVIDTGRLARVQRVACEAAGWGRPLPAGAGRGLASTYTDTCVAQVIEVVPNGKGLKVQRVVSAVDCGRVINPQLVKAQVEGSIVFALTAALKARITVEAGRVQQSNFHDFPLLRFDEMPVIETVLIHSDAAPTGIGEPASHCTAAALANAVFAATGRRLRRLPFDLGSQHRPAA
ncbi:xanthine dehydrogenase family protein molybdopterin-binding subunit [Aquincola sp. S2]|uniref:Xanthine dehydrogenase family protein molybdopterin-binding subunit n=1 Tax=Pseudaquabacterium terrae TaxID=2732868 RepID=A0ABX2ESH9_9BURK|nr:molybdopterin cofactor-binding domain-containing protein [Aquabacterium terrae]NRF71592.1 xanthine dehydrogenase family protein molybdopterin-binding subunit [Aquabacterium terrae]